MTSRWLGGPMWRVLLAVMARSSAGLASYGRPLVVVTHGIAMTVWLAARLSPMLLGLTWLSDGGGASSGSW